MVEGARTLVVAMDAADPTLVRRWAAAGHLPTVQGLLDRGTAATVIAPPGVFVSANWVSIFTGRSPDRHRYLCWDEIDPATYEHRETDPNPQTIRGTPFWEHVSTAGHPQVIVDVPHSWPVPIDGTIVVEWGCHDRHQGTRSWPEGVIDRLDQLTGGHRLGESSHPHRHQFAPCDYAHRAGVLRTLDEERALLEEIRAGVEAKRRASLALFDDGGWELFVVAFGETHCAGHQLWHHHDPTNLRADPAATAAVGGDPVLDVYRRVDAAIGELVDRLGPDDTAYLLLPHGMVSHNDGTELLDPVLARLEQALDDPAVLGRATRLAAAALGPLPGPARRAAGRAAAPLVRRRLASAPADTDTDPPPRADRRWYAVPNNSVTGGVRLNLIGREAHGLVHHGARREVLGWLRDRLLELVNVDTGGPVVTDAWITEDVYDRADDDLLADLHVEWERSAPIERVWSPAVGTVVRPYTHWRNGDHIREGLVVAVGPGIDPGVAAEAIDSIDLGPTISRSVGVDLPGVDGRTLPHLLPAPMRVASLGTPRPPRWARDPSTVGRAGPRAALASLERRARRGGAGDGALWARIEEVATAHAATRAELGRTATQVDRLRHQTWELERQARVGRTMAWLRQQPPSDGPLVSVVLPTRDRAELVTGAIASVLAQTHQAWELLVVDDASTDDTASVLAALADERIRVLPGTGSGVAAARNVALDHARGELVVYLDDDNRFDADWLKAVVAAFDAEPEATVGYGARLVDDFGRHHGLEDDGEVWLQLLPWDRAGVQEFNRADMNVLAHRRCGARFDERLSYFADWDLLLELTAAQDPIEIFAIAAHYTTTAPDRITDVTLGREAHAAEYELVRSKPRGAPDRG